MTRTGRWTLAAILALLLLGGLLLTAAGPGLAAKLLTSSASRYLERRLSIAGPLEIDWGRVLRVSARELRIDNADWAGPEPLLRVEQVSLSLDLWTLIDGPPVIDELQASGLRLRLLRDPVQGDNWDLAPLRESDEDEDWIELLLKRVQLRDGRASLEAPALAQPLLLEVDHFAQDLLRDGRLQFELDSRINGEPLAVTGRFGPFRALLAGRDIGIELDGHVAATRFALQASIDDLQSPRQPQLRMELAGPDAGALSEALGLGRFSKGPLQLLATLAPAGQGVTLRAGGQAGDYALSINGEIADLARLDGVLLAGEASGPSIGRLLRLAGLEATDDPFELRLQLRRDGQELELTDARFRVADAVVDASAEMHRFPSFDDAQLQLAVRGSDVEKFRRLLQIPGVATGAFEASARLAVDREGRERFEVYARTAVGRLEAGGRLGDPLTLVGTQGSFSVDGGRLAMLGEAVGLTGLPDEPYRIDGRLQYAGDDWLELQRLAIVVGDDELRGEGRLKLDPGLPGSRVELRVEGDDLAQIASVSGLGVYLPQLPYAATVEARVGDGSIEFRKVDATIGDSEVQLRGRLAARRRFIGTDLRFSARGPSPRPLLARSEFAAWLPDEGYVLESGVEIGADALLLDSLSLELAGARFDGEARLSSGPGLAGSELRFSGEGPDLARLLPALPDLRVPAVPFRLRGRLTRSGSGLEAEGLRFRIGRARGRLDMTAGLPFWQSAGRLQLAFDGPDASRLPLPEELSLDPLPFGLEARAAWDDGELAVEALDLRLGEASANAAGSLHGLPDAPLADLLLSLEIPDLAQLGLWNGRRPLAQPLSLQAEFTDDQAVLELHRLALRLGESQLDGRLRFQYGQPPRLSGRLHAPRLADPRLFPPEPGPATERPPDARLIPDAPLPLQALRRLDADLELSVDEILVGSNELRDFSASLQLQDGALRLPALRLSGSAGQASLALALLPGADAAELSLSLQMERLRTGLFTVDASDLAALPHLNADIELRGRGATTRELAATLNGRGWLSSSEGRVPNSRLTGLFFGDFIGELLGALNPFVRSEPYTEVSCVALPFVVEQGRIRSAPTFVMQTGKLDILSTGSIDLAQETLDLSFRTEARRGIGLNPGQLLNPFVKVSGSLAAPALTIDPTGTLVTGGAAVATGGLSLLAQTAFGRLFRSASPCEDALREYRKRYAAR